MVNKNNIERYNYCVIDKRFFTVTLTNELDIQNVSFIDNHVFCDVSFLHDDKIGKTFVDAYELEKYWTDDTIPIDEMREKPIPECIRHHKPNWLMKKLFNEKPFDYVRWYYYIRSKKKVRIELMKTTAIVRKY